MLTLFPLEYRPAKKVDTCKKYAHPSNQHRPKEDPAQVQENPAHLQRRSSSGPKSSRESSHMCGKGNSRCVVTRYRHTVQSRGILAWGSNSFGVVTRRMHTMLRGRDKSQATRCDCMIACHGHTTLWSCRCVSNLGSSWPVVRVGFE